MLFQPRRTLALAWICAATIALSACGGESDSASDAGPFVDSRIEDAAPDDSALVAADADTEPMPQSSCIAAPADTRCDLGDTGATLLYVVEFPTIARPVAERGAGIVPGFNYDDRTSDSFDSGGCFVADTVSGPPENDIGVDNHFGTALDQLSFADNVDNGFENGIEDGRLILLLELEGVDDLTNDECVAVNLYYGQLPGGGAPAVRVVTDPKSFVGLEPSQRFDIASDSVENAVSVRRLLDGRIENGRLVAGASDFPLYVAVKLNPDYAIGAVPYEQVRIRASIDANGLSDAVLTGLTPVSDFADALEPYLGPIETAVFETTALSSADIRAVDGTCRCVSSGYEFTAVPAERGSVVDLPSPAGRWPL